MFISYRLNYVSRAAKEAISSRDGELDMMRRKLLDSGDELNAVLTLKDATLRDNTQLRDELDRVRLDNKVRESLFMLSRVKRIMCNPGGDVSYDTVSMRELMNKY